MSGTYKAVQVSAPGIFEVVVRPLTAPGPQEVRIRVEACGVCHSDSLAVEGALPVEYPRVPGHEVVGTIDAVGDGVQAWRIGQRVGVGYQGGNCGYCDSCRRGRFMTCRNQLSTGLDQDGGYAEVMIARASGLAAIPDGMAAVEAAPMLCAGVTTFNGVRNSVARAGDLIAIQGIGGLGHLGVQFARKMGFRVVAIARGPEKESLAMELGAHHYIDSERGDPSVAMRELGGAKAILATAADSRSIGRLVDALTPQGQLIIAGASFEPMEIDAVRVLFNEISITGTVTGTPIDREETMNFAALQGIGAITEVMPLAQAPEAYARMARNDARFRIVLTP
ncbi:MAG: alcohol dehydrogenase [Mycobacterium sp.]|nr:alcohol dehydrogenase [Mycobacterium sp.]